MREFPLVKPYVLSFVELHAFEAVFVRLEWDSGDDSFGEVVALPGYGHETTEDVIEAVSGLLPSLEGLDMAAAAERVLSLGRTHPFAASAIHGAMDRLRLIREAGGASGSVALVFPLSSQSRDLPSVIARAHEAGYRTFKVKVGLGFESDLGATREIAGALPTGCTVRFDANQAFDLEQADEFCQEVHQAFGDAVELLEQPFPDGEYARVEWLAGRSAVPLMMDETVKTIDDVDSSADAGASFVKLKLCKQGSVEQVVRFARKARERGMRVVLGNGVATDVSNLLELWLASAHGELFHGASEATGFAKLVAGAEEMVEVVDGRGVWTLPNRSRSAMPK